MRSCVIRLRELFFLNAPSRCCCYCHLQPVQSPASFDKKHSPRYMFTFYNLRFFLLTLIMASSARLRRTFQYPNDSDSDSDSPQAIDEQGIVQHPPLLPCIHPDYLIKRKRKRKKQNKTTSSKHSPPKTPPKTKPSPAPSSPCLSSPSSPTSARSSVPPPPPLPSSAQRPSSRRPFCSTACRPRRRAFP